MFKKFNWGHGVALALGIFIIFISTFVYRTIFRPEFDHQLVSDEYYKDEMVYKDEINRLKNAEQLKENVSVQGDSTGIVFHFPAFLDSDKITGTLQLQKPEDSKLDVTIPVKVDSLQLIVPKDKLKKGTYNIKLIWQYDSIPYQLNQKFNYR